MYYLIEGYPVQFRKGSDNCLSTNRDKKIHVVESGLLQKATNTMPRVNKKEISPPPKKNKV